MKNRLFQKLFLTVTASIIISVIIMMVLLSVSVNSYFVKEKETLLTENCATIADVLSEETHNSTNFHISLNSVVEVFSSAVGGDAYVCDTTGHIYHCSCDEWKQRKTCVHSGAGINAQVLKDVSDGEYFQFGYFDGRFKNIYYTAGNPFYYNEDEIAGYVFISQPASQLREVWSKLSDMFLISAIIPLVIMFVFLFAMTKKMIKPLNLMSKAAVDMSKGDFSNRIPIVGDDEISDLAEAFNKMSDSLTQLEGMRRSFIANVSHELRTPITTIGGFIDGILDGTIPKDKQEHYLNLVSTETKRLSRLVKSMLDLARLESGEQKVKYNEFSLKELVYEVLFSQEQRIEQKNLKLEGIDNSQNVKINADRDLIHQAIFNLIDNAIKFSPDGEALQFDIKQLPDKRVSFKIKNKGKGISAEELPLIFDRFYKTDRSRSANKDGTGLGLYIVKTIVDIHKATVTVKSVPEQFTEFEIIFAN